MRSNWIVGVIALGMTACGGKSSSDSGCTTANCTTTTPTGDTGTTTPGGTTDEPDSIRVFGFYAKFGWDDTLGQMRPVTGADGEQAPVLEVHLGTANWTGFEADTEDYCIVSFDISGMTQTPFFGGDVAYTNFEYSFAGATLVDDGCTPRLGTDFALDSFADTPANDFATWNIRFGVGGPAPAGYTTTTGADPVFGIFLGPELAWDTTTTTTGPPDFGATVVQAEQVDAGWVVQSGTPIPSNAVETVGGMADGYYEINAVFLMFFPPNME